MSDSTKSQTNQHDANMVLYKQKGGVLATVVIRVAKYVCAALTAILGGGKVIKIIIESYPN